MGTRAKFVCNSVQHFEHGEDDVNLSVTLNACTSEHDDFSKYTPCGTLSIGITNPALKDFFVPGERYFLDISKV
jgi:hypothetical protein